MTSRLSVIQAEMIAVIAQNDPDRHWMMRYLEPEYRLPIRRFPWDAVKVAAVLIVAFCILLIWPVADVGNGTRGVSAQSEPPIVVKRDYRVYVWPGDNPMWLDSPISESVNSTTSFFPKTTSKRH